MTCPRCGAAHEGGAAFCTECGAVISTAPFEEAKACVEPLEPSALPSPMKKEGVPLPPFQRQSPPQSPLPLHGKAHRPPPPPYGYGFPFGMPRETPTSVWKWLGLFLFEKLLWIGHVVLMFVWLFSDTVPQHLKTYARAKLIMAVLGVIVFVLFVVFLFHMGSTLLTDSMTYSM